MKLERLKSSKIENLGDKRFSQLESQESKLQTIQNQDNLEISFVLSQKNSNEISLDDSSKFPENAKFKKNSDYQKLLNENEQLRNSQNNQQSTSKTQKEELLYCKNKIIRFIDELSNLTLALETSDYKIITLNEDLSNIGNRYNDLKEKLIISQNEVKNNLEDSEKILSDHKNQISSLSEHLALKTEKEIDYKRQIAEFNIDFKIKKDQLIIDQSAQIDGLKSIINNNSKQCVSNPFSLSINFNKHIIVNELCIENTGVVQVKKTIDNDFEIIESDIFFSTQSNKTDFNTQVSENIEELKGDQQEKESQIEILNKNAQILKIELSKHNQKNDYKLSIENCFEISLVKDINNANSSIPSEFLVLNHSDIPNEPVQNDQENQLEITNLFITKIKPDRNLIKSLEKGISDLQKSLKTQKSENNKNLKEIKKLLCDIDQKNSEINELKRHSDTEKDDTISSQERKENLHFENVIYHANFKEEYKKMGLKISDLECETSNLECEIVNKDTEIKDTKDLLESHKIMLDYKDKRMNELTQNHNNTIKSLRKLEDEYFLKLSEISNLEKKYQYERSTTKTLQEKLKKITNKTFDEHSELELLKDIKENHTIQIKAQESANLNFKNMFSDLYLQYEQSKKEIESLTKTISDLETNLQVKTEEVEEITDLNENLQNQIKNTPENSQYNYKEEINYKDFVIEELQQKLNDLQFNYSIHEDESKKKNKNLVLEIEMLHKQVLESENVQEEKNKELENLRLNFETNIKSLDEDIESQEIYKKKKESEIQDKKTIIDDYENQIEINDEKIEEMESLINELQETNYTLIEKINEFDLQKNYYEKKLEEKQSKINEFEKNLENLKLEHNGKQKEFSAYKKDFDKKDNFQKEINMPIQLLDEKIAKMKNLSEKKTDSVFENTDKKQKSINMSDIVLALNFNS